MRVPAAMRKGRKRGLALATLALALALPASAAAAPTVPGIMVHDAGSGTQLVRFTQVHCHYAAVRRGATLDRDFTLRPSYAQGWRLVGQVGQFTSYGRFQYPIYRSDQGGDDNWFALRAPDGTIFNNVARPPQAILPPIGGYFTFPSRNRTVVGLGYINAWSLNLQRGVTIAGVARCLYPPRRIP